MMEVDNFEEATGNIQGLLSETVPDIYCKEQEDINLQNLTMTEAQEPSPDLNMPSTNLLHHCLPITNLQLLDGIVLAASEGPSILMKMAYFDNDSFQRVQLFPSQFIISGMSFLPYPSLECGGNPAEWHRKTDKPYDYIYVGFVWAGSVGTLIRLTRSKKGQLKLLEKDNGKCSNILINLDFTPVAVKWLNGGRVLALLSVLNYLVIYERTEDEGNSKSFTSLKETLRVKCSKSETLFSGKIVESSDGVIRVFAGTIFNGICVWDVNGDQAVIKHELKCHDGIIFSVEYNQDKRLLLSTSDDRTVAVWKFAHGSDKSEKVSLLHRFYGHDARVWKALSVRGYVLSVGESSNVHANILESGTLHKAWKAHDGAPIFTCTYDEDIEILYTGGSEGSIRKWPKWWYQLKPRILPFDVIPFDPKTEDQNRIKGSGRWAENKDFPKMAVLLDLNHVLVSMESGRVLGMSWEGKQFDLLYDEKCEGYQIIKISPDHELLAVAGSDGHLYTSGLSFSVNQSSNTNILSAKKLFQTKVKWNILSMIWLSTSRLLVICFNRAIPIIFQDDKTGEKSAAQLVQVFNLNLQRPGVPAAVEILGKYVVLGDELGALHLFRYHKANDEIQKFENCHKEGVTDLLYHDSKLYTSGRDGKVRQFSLNIDEADDMKVEFVPLASFPMPFDWVTGIFVNMNQMLICGFMKEDFVVHSFNEQRTLAKIPCGGGGNRKWDFKYGHGLNGSPNASFAFVKEKEIFYTFLPMTGYLNNVMKEGLHSRTINCGIQLETSHSKNCISYLTGSEDGTLKWFQWDRENNRILSIQNMENHVSSVRSIWRIIVDLPSGASKTFIFTGGGRSQLCIYELDGESERMQVLKEIILVKTRCKQTEGDVRIMDISVIYNKLSNELWCFGACSDGIVRVLYFNVETHKFKIVGMLKGNDHAVMRIQLLQTRILPDAVVVCGVTSNGYLIIWTLSKDNASTNQEKSKNPVEISPQFKKLLRRTAFHSMKMYRGNQEYLIVCGGDDCSINLWSLSIAFTNEGLNFELVEKWTRDQIQRGAVVGVDIDDTMVYSISNDQIVGFWDMNGELKRKIFAGVSDTQGFVLDKANKCILCYGKGVSWVPIV